MARADSRAVESCAQQEQLQNNRATFDAHFKEIAERVLPRQDDFLKPLQPEGNKRTEKIFDSTAPLAVDRAASAVDSLVTPSTQQYQKMEPDDENLLADREVMLYCEEIDRRLFRMRYRPLANFAGQAHECFVSLMAFGTLGMFVDDVMGVGTRYKSIPLSEMYIAENHAGIVDLVHRKFPLANRQAIQKFGEANVSEKVRRDVEKKPFEKHDYLHCVKPNFDYRRGKIGPEGFRFSSYYIDLETKEMVEEGGYRVMPYCVSRHVTAPRETYGRSPAMMVLPDIKMLNEMEKTIIRAAHKIVDPPLLLYGDGILSAFSARPNALNYGGVDEQGRQLVHPMKTGSNLPIALEMTEQKRKLVNDAFYVTLFQILVQNPQMTATEALIRAQEKGQLLAPTISRQQTEFLGPCTARELDIMEMAGALPPMPKKLRDAGGFVKLKYTSPLARLRRAEDGVAIMRTVDFVERASALGRPQVADNYDWDMLSREFSEINALPTRLTVSKEAVEAGREQARQLQAQQMAMQQAEQAAKVAKDGGKAMESMSNVAQPEQEAV